MARRTDRPEKYIQEDKKDPLSRSRIVAFAAAFAAAFLVPVLVGGAVLVSDWSQGAQKDPAEEQMPAGSTLCCRLTAASGEEAGRSAEMEDSCNAVLTDLPAAEDEAVYLGGYAPSEDVREALDACIKDTGKSKHHTGFVMLDLDTGMGVAYNTEQEFYGASSIKLHRIMAIAEAHPEVVTDARQALWETLVESDNDAYEWLCEQYGNSTLDYYLKAARASVRYSETVRYAYYNALSFARLWKHAYDLMLTVPACDEAGAFAEKPSYSSIHRVLGKAYTTRSKAGWIAEGDNRAAVDGGIVYDKESPYLLVIMSDYDSDLTLLDPYVIALENAHQEIKKQK